MKRFALLSFLNVALLSGAAGGFEASSPPDPQSLRDAIEADQSALRDARSQSDAIQQVIREDESSATAVRARLAGGASDLPRIHTDLDRATTEVAQERAAFDPVKARYDAARSNLEAVRTRLLEELEQGDSDFRAEADASRSADEDRSATEQAALCSLARSSTYQDLKAKADRAASRADYFRRAGPAFAKDEENVLEMQHEANDRLAAVEQQFLAGDPAVLSARARAAGEAVKLAAIRAAHEQRLATLPAYADALTALRAEKTPYRVASDALHRAEQFAEAVRTALQRTEDGMAADRETLRQIDDELSEARADLARVNADIDRLSFDLTGALAAADQARVDRQQVSAIGQDAGAPSAPLPLFVAPATFPQPAYVAAPAGVQTVVVNNWVPQPIFFEPSYLFVGSSAGDGFYGRRTHGWGRLCDPAEARQRLNGLATQHGLTGGLQQSAGTLSPQAAHAQALLHPPGRRSMTAQPASVGSGTVRTAPGASDFPQIIGTIRPGNAASPRFSGPRPNGSFGGPPRSASGFRDLGAPLPPAFGPTQSGPQSSGGDGGSQPHPQPHGEARPSHR